MLLPKSFIALGRRALLLALALFLVGCSGGDSADNGDFADDYRRVTNSHQQVATDIQERAEVVSGQGLDGILSVYQELLTSTQEIQDSYEELTPPQDFSDTYNELVEVLQRQIDALTELVAAADERDMRDVTAAAGRLTELNGEWFSLQQDMEELFASCGEPCD